MVVQNKLNTQTQKANLFLHGLGAQDNKETLINGYEVSFGSDGNIM